MFKNDVEKYPKVPNPLRVDMSDALEIYPRVPSPRVVEVSDAVEIYPVVPRLLTVLVVLT